MEKPIMKWVLETDENGLYYPAQMDAHEAMMQGIEIFNDYQECRDVCDKLNN
jgi:hypothetical protein